MKTEAPSRCGDVCERMRERHESRAKTLQWLRVLLPLVLSYPLLPVHRFGRWLRPRVLARACLWLAIAAVLLIRRDWRGAAALTAMYAVVDAWLMVFLMRGGRPDRAARA
jgi:hypothetical protein